jgi:hypothetical protein
VAQAEAEIINLPPPWTLSPPAGTPQDLVATKLSEMLEAPEGKLQEFDLVFPVPFPEESASGEPSPEMHAPFPELALVGGVLQYQPEQAGTHLSTRLRGRNECAHN